MAPKSATSKAATRTAAAGKKHFPFKRVAAGVASASGGGSTWRAGQRRKAPKSVAVFMLIAAKYQKGDKAGQFTGAIYFRGVPLYVQNETFKTMLHKHTLTEVLRLNTELKLYTCKVWTAKQARMLLKAMKELDGCAQYVPEDIDESIFEHANATEISIINNIDVEVTTMVGLHGTTFPFKEILKEKGFTFLNELNGFDGVSMWIAPQATVDIEDLVALFHEYGFEVDMFDGVDED